MGDILHSIRLALRGAEVVADRLTAGNLAHNRGILKAQIREAMRLLDRLPPPEPQEGPYEEFEDPRTGEPLYRRRRPQEAGEGGERATVAVEENPNAQR